MSKAENPARARIGELVPPLLVMATAGVMILLPLRRGKPEAPARQAARVAVATRPVVSPRLAPPPVVVHLPSAPQGPDLIKLADAEAQLDDASRDRARAEVREAGARLGLERAQLELDRSIRAYRTLGRELRNPTYSLASLQARGGVLKAEVSRLETEMRGLAEAPAPRKKPLLDRTPVARVVDGQEYHFELSRGRVTFVDLDRLVALIKADAQLQLRLASGSMGMRPIISKVGPVGAFSIRYELGPSIPSSLDRMLSNPRSVSYGLLGWELVPERETRGETLESACQPASDFFRAVNSLNPQFATITLWVYPDSFELYRQLRPKLHEQGFLVAARPLPAGMAIRGSPDGSSSAGQ